MADILNRIKNKKNPDQNATIAFTLPISCQICLGKVKQPVVCPNQHAFCECCLKVWLQRNKQCPSCRVEIGVENPYKKVIGGLSSDNEQSSHDSFSNAAVRRARIELIAKDYEGEIERLQSRLESVEKENQRLQLELEQQPPFKSESQSVVGDIVLDLNDKINRSRRDNEIQKKQMKILEQGNKLLTDENVNLTRENERIRMEVASRSPMRYGRFTVATLQTKVEKYEKQVKQLQKALECGDTYIEQLQNQLQALTGKAELKMDNKRKLSESGQEITGNQAKKRLFQNDSSDNISVNESQNSVAVICSQAAENLIKTEVHSGESAQSEPGCSHWDSRPIITEPICVKIEPLTDVDETPQDSSDMQQICGSVVIIGSNS